MGKRAIALVASVVALVLTTVGTVIALKMVRGNKTNSEGADWDSMESMVDMDKFEDDEWNSEGNVEDWGTFADGDSVEDWRPCEGNGSEQLYDDDFNDDFDDGFYGYTESEESLAEDSVGASEEVYEDERLEKDEDCVENSKIIAERMNSKYRK